MDYGVGLDCPPGYGYPERRSFLDSYPLFQAGLFAAGTVFWSRMRIAALERAKKEQEL